MRWYTLLMFEKKAPEKHLIKGAKSDREKYIEIYKDFPDKDELICAYKDAGIEDPEHLDPYSWIKLRGCEGRIGAWAFIAFKEHYSFGRPTYSGDQFEDVPIELPDDTRKEKLAKSIRARILGDDEGARVNGVIALAALIGSNRSDWSAISDILEDNVVITPDEPSSYARVYAAVYEAAKIIKKPMVLDGLRNIQNIIEQNPQMMHPRHILDLAQKYEGDHRIPAFLRGGIMHSLGYALRFFGGTDYEQEITNRLDFDDPANFSKTAKFLELIPAFYNIGDEYSYSGDNVVVTRVRNALADAVTKGKGSYLLNMRAGHILEQMKDDEEFISPGRDRTPFLLYGDRYAWHLEDGVRLAKKSVNTQVVDLVAKITEIESKLVPPQYMVDAALARGESYVTWDPPRILMDSRRSAYQELATLFTEPLRNLSEVANRDEDLITDYEYLLTKPVRDEIKNKLGADISKLKSVEEQIYFLDFARRVGVTEVGELKEFNASFGLTGLRSFLSVAYDSQSAEYIKKIGSTFPVDTARMIFAKFTEYVDTAEQVEASLVEVVEKTGQTGLHEVVRRSLLERATSFLRTCGTPPVSTMPVAERAAYIERELGKLSADASRTAAVSREIKKMGGTVTSEEVLGVRVRKVPATALRSLGRQYAQTEMMLKSNYKEDPNRGYQYTSQFREAIAKGAGALADKKDTTLFLATKDNEKVHDEDVLACLRFDEIKNKAGKTERLYFGSFAADQAYMGGGFGEGLLKASFAETEAKYSGVPIDAHCDPRAPITQKYLEMGFVATGLEEYEQVPSFSITLDRDRNKRLGTKSFGLDQLITRAQAAGGTGWNGTDATYLYAGDTPPDFASLVGKKSGNRTLALTRYKIVEKKRKE